MAVRERDAGDLKHADHVVMSLVDVDHDAVHNGVALAPSSRC